MKTRVEHESFALTGRQSLLLVMLVAVILRAIGANSEFWFDEIATVLNYVRPPLRTLLSTYGSANNHVFNSVLTQFSIEIFGSEQPWVVRLPAILFGIANAGAFHFVARQLWTNQVALIGTFMFAMSYHGVYYTQPRSNCCAPGVPSGSAITHYRPNGFQFFASGKACQALGYAPRDFSAILDDCLRLGKC